MNSKDKRQVFIAEVIYNEIVCEHDVKKVFISNKTSLTINVLLFNNWNKAKMELQMLCKMYQLT